MKSHIFFLVLFCFAITVHNANADIVNFIATGAQGNGLLQGNIDPPTGEFGSGGIGATGITFNTDTNILHVDLEWGSANGYTDLSSDVFKVHLHGPTASSGTAAFGQTAGVMNTLSNTNGTFNPSASSGRLEGTFFVDNLNDQFLLGNRTYINVHLSDNDTGVIRGYLVNTVPEPSAILPVLILAMMCIMIRRRQPVLAFAHVRN